MPFAKAGWRGRRRTDEIGGNLAHVLLNTTALMKSFFRPIALVTLAVGSLLSSADGALPADASNVVVDVNFTTLVKLNAVDGTILWSVPVNNDGALAVDPVDFSVYTAVGGHNPGTNGTTYKFAANGAPGWTNSITLNSFCDFDFVTNAAVDATSGQPGVVWSENNCFGAVAKSDRGTGAQQWSVLTYDVGRPTIDPLTGQIYTISNAGGAYDAETIYSIGANGAVNFAASCEGYTDLNPADGQLYRGGNGATRGCGTTIYQMNLAILGAVNWSLDLSSFVSSVDALLVQPWPGGWIYAASINSSKIVIIDPATRSVVGVFATAVPPVFLAMDPNGGNIYVADSVSPFVIAYSWTGALVWINPNLGGSVKALATARGLIGTPPPATTPTPTPSATPTPPPPCPAPTVRITTTATSLHKGHDATINFTGKNLCQNVTVKFSVVTKAVSGVDFTLTDQNGQDATQLGQLTSGSLTLHSISNSRRKVLPLSVQILPDRAYYRGNIKITVQLLGN